MLMWTFLQIGRLEDITAKVRQTLKDMHAKEESQRGRDLVWKDLQNYSSIDFLNEK